MKTPIFDELDSDSETFAPFVLQNELDSEWKDVRLEFSAWEWIETTYGTDTIDDYYLNGPGVEVLVKAALWSNGINPEMPGIHYNSEADTCYIHFEDMNTAIQAAELAAQSINDPQRLRDTIKIAIEQDFEDG